MRNRQLCRRYAALRHSTSIIRVTKSCSASLPQKIPSCRSSKRLMAEHPECAQGCSSATNAISSNPKLNNVLKGWRAARARLDHPRRQQRADAARLHRAAVRELACRHRARRFAAGRLPAAKDFGPSSNARSSTPIRRAGSMSPTRSGSDLPRARPCCGGEPISSAPAALRRWRREVAEDAAATKIVRGAGLKVRLVDRAVRAAARAARRAPRSGTGNCAGRGCAARASSIYFLPEIFSGGVLPIDRGCPHRARTGRTGAAERQRCFGALWYGGEMLLAAAAGWHGHRAVAALRADARPVAAGAVRQRAATATTSSGAATKCRSSACGRVAPWPRCGLAFKSLRRADAVACARCAPRHCRAANRLT